MGSRFARTLIGADRSFALGLGRRVRPKFRPASCRAMGRAFEWDSLCGNAFEIGTPWRVGVDGHGDAAIGFVGGADIDGDGVSETRRGEHGLCEGGVLV